MNDIKKFVLGLLCGMALLAGTAAVASNEIKALLSSIHVSFQLNGQSSTLDSAKDGQVLNYKGQLFVPLRTFAEKMGGAVYYHPAQNGSKGSVEIFYEDDRDLPIQDKDGYVRMGHLDLKFAQTLDVFTPYIEKGIIKFNKSIPADKDIVLALLDSSGKQVAVSGPIKLDNYKVSQMGKGDISTFETIFPYVTANKNYKLDIQIVPKQAWSYTHYSVDAVVQGAGGINGFPLGMIISNESSSTTTKGTIHEIEVDILNLKDDDHIVISKPATFEIEISQNKDGKSQLIRTIKTKPLSGTIYWKKGAVKTTVAWDEKDNKGKSVTPGEYFISIKLPTTIEGTMASTPKDVVTFTLEPSMQTMQRPITVK
ncbi:hypothetical protein I6N90_18785 [Paenibacillus sp. GSMTC-2017]|uniref:hypothetical protein n=1 Tax=Paenibacillus sp. GSMTC-2017 TaxID=2794350 RepID=UPI0018D740FD|nr:hypothetical protein [Paenibacillus sp. GSMTC-2017]MBH5319850.1 hypothetical protein [Paenibacillus sp. GSMTC-2017]